MNSRTQKKVRKLRGKPNSGSLTICQRLVLLMGILTLLLTIWTSPRMVSIGPVAVMGTTLLTFLLSKSHKPKKEEGKKAEGKEIIPESEQKEVELQEIFSRREEKVVDFQEFAELGQMANLHEIFPKGEEKVVDLWEVFPETREKVFDLHEFSKERKNAGI